jgi:hypothetical protein
MKGNTMITDANNVKCYEDLLELTNDAWDQLMNIIAIEVDQAMSELKNKPTKKKTMSHKMG